MPTIQSINTIKNINDKFIADADSPTGMPYANRCKKDCYNKLRVYESLVDISTLKKLNEVFGDMPVGDVKEIVRLVDGIRKIVAVNMVGKKLECE